MEAADAKSASPAVRAAIRQRHALALLKLGRGPDAIPVLRTALDLLDGVAEAEAQHAMTLDTLGLVLRETGDIVQAEELHRTALSVLRRTGDTREEVRAAVNLAVTLKDQGKLAEARTLLEQAVPNGRRIRDKALLGHALLTLGLVHELLNEFDASESRTREAVDAYRACGDREGEAAALHNLGRALDAQGRPVEAMEYFVRSLEINREIGAVLGIADDLGAMASLFQLADRYDEAARLHREALRLQEAAGHARGMIATLTDLSIIDRDTGRFDAALERLDRARSLAEAMGDPREIHDVRLTVAEVHMVKEDYAAARRSYELAAEAIADARRALLDERDALAYFSEERLEALNMLVRLSAHLDDPIAALEWAEAARGQELLRRLADAELPAPSGASAETLRAEADERRRLRDIEERARTPDGVLDARLAAERAAALERLRELEAVLHVQDPEYVTLRRGERLDWAGLKRCLADEQTTASHGRAVLVEYFVTDDRTFVFGVTDDAAEPDIVTLDISREEVRDLAGSVSGALLEDHPALGERLRDERLRRLAAPVARWARPGDLVCLVPHDALHGLPLHAVDVDGLPLLDRNPVAVTPSASVLRHCQAKRRGRRETALIVADPPAPKPLVFAREQAHAVAGGFTRHEVLAGGDASRAALLQRLGPGGECPDVLHFTAHGVFDLEEPMKSGVELADGRLTAEDLLNLRLDVDLVTLGACETGVSDRRPGDELIGLTRALLHAGAPSALVTLWRVDELSTSLLFTAFYAGLAAGSSKAEALRAAQSRLRELTVADALAYARQAKARYGGSVVPALVDAEARLLVRAGDITAAEQLVTDAMRSPGLAPEDLEGLRVTLLQARLSLPEPDAGPDLRAFDDPYHWAPFVLVGDWL